jgi:hypothetical protein
MSKKINKVIYCCSCFLLSSPFFPEGTACSPPLFPRGNGFAKQGVSTTPFPLLLTPLGVQSTTPYSLLLTPYSLLLTPYSLLLWVCKAQLLTPLERGGVAKHERSCSLLFKRAARVGFLKTKQPLSLLNMSFPF